MQALGAEWPTNKAANLTYTKELARLDECVARLSRARALPLPAPKLALVVSTGCLSLLDYINLPDPKPYAKVRTLVKDVFGLKAGAPEVVMCVLTKGILDPHISWLLSVLRLWHHALQLHPPKAEVDELGLGQSMPTEWESWSHGKGSRLVLDGFL